MEMGWGGAGIEGVLSGRHLKEWEGTGWKDGGSCPYRVVLKVHFLLIFKGKPTSAFNRPCLNFRSSPSQASIQTHEGDLSF